VIDTERKVHRHISAYSETTGVHLGIIELQSFDLVAFQAHFRVADQADPMYDCYRMAPEDLSFIRRYAQPTAVWDFAAFSYFVEATRLE